MRSVEDSSPFPFLQYFSKSSMFIAPIQLLCPGNKQVLIQMPYPSQQTAAVNRSTGEKVSVRSIQKS